MRYDVIQWDVWCGAVRCSEMRCAAFYRDAMTCSGVIRLCMCLVCLVELGRDSPRVGEEAVLIVHSSLEALWNKIP